jgi:protein SCO1/2
VLLLSFDPRDGPVDAGAAQHEDAAANSSAGVQNWHYLTGAPSAIGAVMNSIGFHYFFDARDGQYAHGAGAVILSPQGKTMQYLFGVQFSAQTLRLALVNAVHGRIGNVLDQFILFCCNYDASTGQYSLAIQNIMQALGVLTALLLGVLIFMLLRAEANRAV